MLNFPDAPVAGQSFPPFTFDGVKWIRASTPPSNAVPAVSGVGTPGDDAEYTRGDHVHPTDTSRAPTVTPSFTGAQADILNVTGVAYIGTDIRTETGRVISQMAGNVADQPSVAMHSNGATGGRGVARGFFLDASNYLAFGGMDGAGNPLDNVARFDNIGHIWLNGTAVLGRDPTSPMEAASKQYVDAKAAAGGGGPYIPLSGGSMGNIYYPNNSVGWLGANGSTAFEVQSGGGNDACITFHRPGAFACNFGLGSDHNFYYGGWSFGAAAWRFWTTRDFGGFPSSNERFAHAGDYLQAYTAGLVEPWGSCMTGSTGITTFTAVTQRYRYWQLLTTGW